MHFIGIISEDKEYKNIVKELEESIKQKSLNIIYLSEQTLDNYQNIKFSSIIICKEIKNKESFIEKIKKLLQNSKYLIINSDINLKNLTLENISLKIITFGFNTKATLTVTSVQEEEILIDMQREIITITGKKIETGERKINFTKQTQIYDKMIEFIIKKIYELQK